MDGPSSRVGLLSLETIIPKQSHPNSILLCSSLLETCLVMVKQYSLPSPQDKNTCTYATNKFVLSPYSVSTLKSKFSATHQHLNPSRAESVSAFIWSRFMVSTQGDETSEVGKRYRVVQAVNLRPRANLPLPKLSFGNVGDCLLTCHQWREVRKMGMGW
ncbi:vinorine synthase-like [Camellia sinensis]|uniref:vinorine synthase-like n=1 Tax=Camellia sinensis TaxID=4442 RepID=UPI001036DEB9|nr:vinorine synthase-like [Camellia sinensis]